MTIFAVMKKKGTFFLPAAFLLVILLAGGGLLCGGVTLTPGEVWQGLLGQGEAAGIVRGIRLPRVLTALLAGAALALSGAQMQAVFRNPLADPHIMGVSGGAGLGAALATFTSIGTAGIALSAFAGALATSLLVLLAARRFPGSGTLLIFGVMLGFIFSALTSLVEYTANEESLKLFYSWAAGSFQGAGASGVWGMAGALAVGAALALWQGKGLDLLLFGDEYAALSGAPVGRIRSLAVLGCCLMTGTITAFCGPLGFVGIIAPHIARRLGATSAHRTVLPGSILTGAILSLAADILAQAFPTPVPAGSTLALLGIPLILVIMMRK